MPLPHPDEYRTYPQKGSGNLLVVHVDVNPPKTWQGICLKTYRADAPSRVVECSSVIRRLRRAFFVLLVVYAAFLGGMFWVMSQRPERFGAIMRHFPMPLMLIVPFETMWNQARGGTLQTGEMAPDFTLPTADKKSEDRR